MTARLVGRYALYDPIGRGATASVLLGVMRGRTPTPVAVKVLHESHARDAGAVARLVDEVRLARRVHHANVVEVLELVSNGEEMLVVMEYVHGEPLSRLLHVARQNAAPVPPAIAAAIARDVLAGLSAAHDPGVGIVHRDVTPENVLVAASGTAKLADFGVAKAEGRLHQTRDGGVKGKLAYLAPEQVGGDVTPRTDLYAVGLVLWEMLALDRPLEGPNEAAILAKALDPNIAPPSSVVADVPPALDAAIMRALAKEPAERFASASDFAAAIAAAVVPATREEVAAWVEASTGESLRARTKMLAAILQGEAESEGARKRSSALAGPVVMLAVASTLLAVAFVWRRASTDPAPAPATFPDPPPIVESSVPADVPVPAPSPEPDPSTAPAPKKRPSVRAAGSNDCDPPWYIDAKGIKRYDPACMK